MAEGQPKRTRPREPRALQEAARTASTAVRQAAAVLEGELAATLPGVRRLEERFARERRVDQKEFTEVLDRLRQTSHEFVDLAAERMADLRSTEVQQLSERLTTDAHDLFDSMINLVALAPDILNRLAGGAAPGGEGGPPPPPKAGRAMSRGRKRTAR